MQGYNAVVRISGDVMHEVDKVNLTAPEVMVLTHIHGQDAIRGVEEGDQVKRPATVERARLEELYGVKAVSAVFGPTVAGAKLPTKLSVTSSEDDDDGDPGGDGATVERETLTLRGKAVDKGARPESASV